MTQQTIRSYVDSWVKMSKEQIVFPYFLMFEESETEQLVLHKSKRKNMYFWFRSELSHYHGYRKPIKCLHSQQDFFTFVHLSFCKPVLMLLHKVYVCDTTEDWRSHHILTAAFIKGLMMNFLSLKETFLTSLQGNPIFGLSLEEMKYMGDSAGSSTNKRQKM